MPKDKEKISREQQYRKTHEKPAAAPKDITYYSQPNGDELYDVSTFVSEHLQEREYNTGLWIAQALDDIDQVNKDRPKDERTIKELDQEIASLGDVVKPAKVLIDANRAKLDILISNKKNLASKREELNDYDNTEMSAEDRKQLDHDKAELDNRIDSLGKQITVEKSEFKVNKASFDKNGKRLLDLDQKRQKLLHKRPAIVDDILAAANLAADYWKFSLSGPNFPDEMTGSFAEEYLADADAKRGREAFDKLIQLADTAELAKTELFTDAVKAMAERIQKISPSQSMQDCVDEVHQAFAKYRTVISSLKLMTDPDLYKNPTKKEFDEGLDVASAELTSLDADVFKTMVKDFAEQLHKTEHTFTKYSTEYNELRKAMEALENTISQKSSSPDAPADYDIKQAQKEWKEVLAKAQTYHDKKKSDPKNEHRMERLFLTEQLLAHKDDSPMTHYAHPDKEGRFPDRGAQKEIPNIKQGYAEKRAQYIAKKTQELNARSL